MTTEYYEKRIEQLEDELRTLKKVVYETSSPEALIESQDLGGDALAYFLTGYKYGRNYEIK